MKTQLLLMSVSFLLFFDISQAQQISFDFKIPDSNPSGVTIENRGAPGDKKFETKKAIIKKTVEEAIRKYSLVIFDNDHPLNKVIGFFNRKNTQKTLENISLKIWVLEEDDPQERPMIFKLPAIFKDHNQNAFILKIPREFVDKAEEKIRFEHLAFHEIAHIVNGDFEPFAETDEMERERRAEYLVYTIFGYEKYKKSLIQFFKDNEEVEGTSESFIRKWMMFIGVEDSKGKPVVHD